MKVCPAQDTTASEAQEVTLQKTIRSLNNLHERLRKSECRLNEMANRFVGPVPVEPSKCEETCPEAYADALGYWTDKLSDAAREIERKIDALEEHA